MQMHDESIPVSAEAGAADASASTAQADGGGATETASPIAAENARSSGHKVPVRVDDEKQGKTESTMIDVHAPHGGLHTWRDFWIHLGTIALGLLIAISLEQTVEWMHHLHQRHQLEADLSAELEVNHDVVLGDLRRGALLRVRMVALRDGADRMHDSGGKLKFAYIPNPKVDPKTKLRLPSAIVPSDAAWATAKESELVGLLPRWEAEVYARLDLQHEFLVDSVKGFLQAESAVKAFEVRFEQNGDASVGPDMARITISQLDDYSVLLSREMQTSDELSNRLNLYDAEAQAILHGARSEQEMLRHMQETGRN